ncbi:hypothetical protein WJX72_001088 [[Myrmecia] bisecta]|uniref:SWIM-type domain-containing protein n=1 Tax=[Myrmecia] bisecta TaxID=41462 RepID=A0AAW1P4G0_9CHLO
MLKEPTPSVARVADSVFSQLQSAAPDVVDSHLSSLNFLFDKNCGRALQIVDQGGVKCFIAQDSRRKVFQVQGKTAADQYIVFPEHYCSCQAFFYDTVGRGDAVYCKHQLAARIADSLQRCVMAEVPDTVLAMMLITH